MRTKILRKFDLAMIRNAQKNEIRKVLDEIEKLVFQKNIKDNPVLRRMQKEDWIVNVNNKNIIIWANKYTLNIVRGALIGE